MPAKETDQPRFPPYTLTGHGPPLLLLHGFTGSAEERAGLIPALAPLRQVIAVDLPGHGRAPAPADPSCYTMERTVADLLALLDHLGHAACDILGYSMGGRVALHLAATAPARVRALVLESASPGIEDPAERAARAAADEALAARIEQEGLEWFVDHWASLPLFASQARLPEAARAALRERRLRGSATGYANSLRGMGAGRQRSLWADLPAMRVPALIISGELDEKYVAIGARMAAAMPLARQVIVPGAGHTVHLEQPEAFRDLVVGYITGNTVG
ncbi:MAG: 2-succinyl-6-hydroxy-2,4-cyclohexadiene-1-carboxylate synthase [Chloroflexaceae bacterium]|nr:2-succinyl-6-hydroxy-2,4-cyclohexadiene-1-carboxylate synthase [Chloroflexaceae bacterium]